jgi:predicted RNA-binding Zn ribbon-like protein
MGIGENELLELLNSAPVVDGKVTETLDDESLRPVRDELQAVIRGKASPDALNGFLDGIVRVPAVGPSGLTWRLEGPSDRLPAAEYVFEWARVSEALPGRLRPCANHECSKFLIDHSRPNTARWCSMATCGNRMKARRHYQRQGQAHGETQSV